LKIIARARKKKEEVDEFGTAPGGVAISQGREHARRENQGTIGPQAGTAKQKHGEVRTGTSCVGSVDGDFRKKTFERRVR